MPEKYFRIIIVEEKAEIVRKAVVGHEAGNSRSSGEDPPGWPGAEIKDAILERIEDGPIVTGHLFRCEFDEGENWQ